jgi:hypothetical protein
MTGERWTWILNFTGFQAGWFVCVLGGAHNLGLAGACTGLLFLLIHIAGTPGRIAELKLILCAGILGTLFDTALLETGTLRFHSHALGAALAPEWMIVLWMLFAATLNVSLGWLKQKLWVAALAGAVSGPLAYLAGERLGAMVVIDRNALLMILVFGWGVAVPLLAWTSRRFSGFTDHAVYRNPCW